MKRTHIHRWVADWSTKTSHQNHPLWFEVLCHCGCGGTKVAIIKQKPSKPKRIKLVSKRRQKWLGLYYAEITQDVRLQTCAHCGLLANKHDLSRHHPYGRTGKWILTYVYICPEFHDWIHAHENKAMELGWLQPEKRGRKHTGERIIPWKTTNQSVD